MHYAVQTASIPAIKLLLLYNVDINLQDNVWLILHYCLHFLLNFIFLPSKLNTHIAPFQDGWTPLHVAVQAQRTDIIKLLLIKGADRTLKNQVNICWFQGILLFLFSSFGVVWNLSDANFMWFRFCLSWSCDRVAQWLGCISPAMWIFKSSTPASLPPSWMPSLLLPSSTKKNKQINKNKQRKRAVDVDLLKCDLHWDDSKC